MKLSKLFVAIGLASAVLTSSAYAERMHISVVAKGLQNQYWQAVEMGTVKAANDFDVSVDFQGPATDGEGEYQNNILRSVVGRNPDAICIAAIDHKTVIQILKEAKARNIPIIGVDSGVQDAPEGLVNCTAATDNYAAGRLAAMMLLETIQDTVDAATPAKPVRIGGIALDKGSPTSTERLRGFIEGIIEGAGAERTSVVGDALFANPKSGAAVIIEAFLPDVVEESELAVGAEQIMQRKDLLAMFGANETATRVMLKANNKYKVLGPDKVMGVGFDSGSRTITAVRNRELLGAVTQNPVQMGYQGVKQAIAAKKGEKVYDVDTGAYWYDHNNIDDPMISANLYH